MALLTRRAHGVALLLAVLAFSCGDDSEDVELSVDAGLDANIARPTTYQATLVPATSDDASVFVPVPHEVSFLDVNGNPLSPPVSTTSGEDGRVELSLPANAVSIYVVGVGPVEETSSTYDTVVVSNNWSSGDPLLRISNRGLLSYVESLAGFEVRRDRAAMTGAVYWTVNRVRREPVGCATLYIDGKTEPDEDQAQRYVAPDRLPVPLATQSETNRLGRFYFGNVRVGLHSIRVSLDDGKTFIAEQSFFVSRPRSGAQSPTKSILYQFGVDIEAAANPTPTECPQLD